MRKPQLAAARATVASAEAQLARAQLDLERTRISAPYEGRVLEQNVDIGQYVSPGTVLGKVYAVDYVEIRLPLSAEQLKYVHIPEEFRDEAKDHPPGPAVTLTTRVGNDAYQWQGTIVRAAAAVDTKSRQLFVVAQVDDPYAKSAVTRAPLRVGQFVEAEIAGALLHDVIVIPRAALRSGDSVFIVDDLGQIHRRDLTLVWRDQNSAVVKTGVTAGEALVLTPLTGTGDGMRVAATIDGVAPAPSGKSRGQDDKRLVSRGGQAMKKTRLDE